MVSCMHYKNTFCKSFHLSNSYLCLTIVVKKELDLHMKGLHNAFTSCCLNMTEVPDKLLCSQVLQHRLKKFKVISNNTKHSVLRV